MLREKVREERRQKGEGEKVGGQGCCDGEDEEEQDHKR